MKPFNYLFYLVLFLGLFLPTNDHFFIPLTGALLKVNELAFILLPGINFFCKNSGQRLKTPLQLKWAILLFLSCVLITEFLFKPLVLRQALGDSFKSLRLGIPLFSSLILVFMGIKPDSKIIWKIFLLAIGCSIIISIISIFIQLPIYTTIGDDDNILESTKGRILNSNASFGIAGLYLLFENKNKWYAQGKLVRYVSILSIAALIMTFNRTYLILLLIEFMYLGYKNMSPRYFLKIVGIPLLFIGLVLFMYTQSELISKQIDKRILSVVFQETSIVESAIQNNRDNIYDGILKRTQEGYWFIGLPYTIGIFQNYSVEKGYFQASKTDISFVNILLRFGIFALIGLFFVLYCLLKEKRIPFIVLVLYVLASLNVDALFNQNTIFFYRNFQKCFYPLYSQIRQGVNRVLVITSILPVSSIERKKNENDILLETEDRLKAFSNGILFSYFFVIPYANRLLSLLSPKWKSYCDLIQKEEIVLRGRKVIILGMIMFAKKFFFRSAYYHLALWINRKQIRRTIQNFQPTILHADNVDTSGFLARKIGEKYNIPYIITLRGIKQSHDQLVVKNLAGAKNLIAISANHQMQAKTITSRPIALIPHGISASFFISNVAKHAGKAIRVISVCRLIKLKNLDKVINALSSVEGNFIYDIYGEGPEQAFLDELIQEKGMTQKIKLKGFVPNSELPGVLMNAHLFIMPSYPESLGRVYFEAMAAGLPVIGAKNTGIDGLIEHGKEGFLVNHLNEPELAGILRDILNEPGVLYDMGIHARKKAEEFRWDRICGKLLNVYEDTEAIQIS